MEKKIDTTGSYTEFEWFEQWEEERVKPKLIARLSFGKNVFLCDKNELWQYFPNLKVWLFYASVSLET